MRQYSRIFVTLKQERSDYSHNGRQALGRCIIESKDNSGKISVYVQDLKPEVLYKLYMVSCQGGKSIGVPIGAVNVDERGKCETKWEFDAGNIGGSGLPIEDFNVITINVPKKNDIVSILTGFTSGLVMWKNNYKDFSDNNRTEEPPRAEEPHRTEKVYGDTPLIEQQDTSDKEKTLEAVHIAFKEIVSKFNDEMEMLKNYSLGDIEATEVETAEHTQAKPFGNMFDDIEWAKISLKELTLMNLNFYMDIPLVVLGHRKYKHLLLGKNSVDKYILGVPENYCIEDEPEAAASGFKFASYDGSEKIDGCFGYWMLDI